MVIEMKAVTGVMEMEMVLHAVAGALLWTWCVPHPFHPIFDFRRYCHWGVVTQLTSLFFTPVYTTLILAE